jgi:hypothetical protein
MDKMITRQQRLDGLRKQHESLNEIASATHKEMREVAVEIEAIQRDMLYEHKTLQSLTWIVMGPGWLEASRGSRGEDDEWRADPAYAPAIDDLRELYTADSHHWRCTLFATRRFIEVDGETIGVSDKEISLSVDDNRIAISFQSDQDEGLLELMVNFVKEHGLTTSVKNFEEDITRHESEAASLHKLVSAFA